MESNKYAVWNYLYKLPEEEAKNININDIYASLPENIVTDGYGNFYRIPTTGSTPFVQLENDRYFKYRYNWATKEIEVYFLDSVESNQMMNVDVYNQIEAVSVSPSDFIDNPEYWYRDIAGSIEEDTGIVLADINIKEAMDIFNEFENDSLDEYNYTIKVSTEIYPLDGIYDESFDEDYKQYVEKYKKESEYLGQDLIITAEYNIFEGQIIINVSFPLPLTKEELIEIFEDTKLYLESVSSESGYSVNLGLEDIF